MVQVPSPFRKAVPEKPQPTWPPNPTDEQFEVLISDIKDWQIVHGSQLKVVSTEDEGTSLSQPVGTTLFPTLFPHELIQQALGLQTTYNKLYCRIVGDEKWLYGTLEDLIAVDPLTQALWSVHQELKKQGVVHTLSMGIYRSDYMLHFDRSELEAPILKQVEFNTISCAGGVHSNRISDMHQYLKRTEAYRPVPRNKAEAPCALEYLQPPNKTLETIVAGLRDAQIAYMSSYHCHACILMIVQPNNFNIADERPIEHALWDLNIPTFRLEWGLDVMNCTRKLDNGVLIYHPPTRMWPIEFSVVYYRAGFEAEEYSPEVDGIGIRLRLEASRAIQCSSVLSHLTTFKKVQQALALPGALERFLDSYEASQISATFTKMHPLDASPDGLLG